MAAIDRKTFLKSIFQGVFTTGTILAVLPHAAPPSAHAEPPLVGGRGLCPNAWDLAAYIRATYPGVLSIGGVRPDRLPDHPSGHAIDIMVGTNTALGNTIHADISSQASRFGIKYTLWQVSQHYDHIHVTVL